MGLKEFWKFMVTDPSKVKKEAPVKETSSNKIITSGQKETSPSKIITSTQTETPLLDTAELGIKESTAKREIASCR